MLTLKIIGNGAGLPIMPTIPNGNHYLRPTLNKQIPLTLNIISNNPPPVKLAPIRKYTLPIFLERAQIIHGTKFDYSRIKPEHIQGYYSDIEIICRICGYEWITSIASHINQRCGCPSCAGVVPWTLERFLKQALQIHGNLFDYSQITPQDIQGAHSHIPISCNTCGHKWNPSITHHISSRNGCPECYGNVPWNLERLLVRAKEIHGDKYNYDNIIAEMVINQKSKIPIICNNCGHQWEPSISNHINNKTGCPECYGNIPWTLERFIIKAHVLHGDKHDYSQITNDHIRGKRSKIPIICKICGYFWNPSIDDYINRQSGCPDCVGKAPWTLDRLLKQARDIHGEKYDYSQVTENHVQGWTARIPVICLTCGHQWSPRIYNHITGKTGCPRCRKSHGEIACENTLKLLGIDYICEFILDNLPRKRFDFKFEYNNYRFLLEFDGLQHFQFSPHYHNDEEEFLRKQQVDIIKTRKAIEAEYHIMHIDYTQIDNIQTHIRAALNSKNQTYFSNPTMYTYIINALK
jgi:formylmethanofuran dehydrogenase subunit E